mgnify:CR=1 FL=1
MTQLENKDVILRAIEPEDIDLLFELENDTDLWKYSNRSQPYSCLLYTSDAADE